MPASPAWLAGTRVIGGPGALLAAAALALGGCASAPPATAPAPADVATPAVVRSTEPAAANLALSEFEARQRQVAEAATRQGHWADAAWAWDVVLALKPGDAAALSRRSQAVAATQAGVAERLPRARQALQRGDGDAALQLYLEVLALSPGQAEAAEALRNIERDRVARQHLGQLSRHTLTRRAVAESMVRPGTSGAATAVPEVQRNEVEHASLLAAQGELGAAIELLKPLAEARKGDPGARALLADLYQRQAENLAGANPAAAIDALERSLQLNPTNRQARARLAELRAGPKPPPAAPAARANGARL
jgi:tetratricopeptide (TPR) repeat protein